MSNEELPACGLYKTTSAIGSVPAGRLVYFHNHGDPGPGVYLPSGWKQNRALFDQQGHLLGDEANAKHLFKVVPQGLYRVELPFHCCDKNCRRFEAEELVQLGYNAAAEPILFIPTWSETGISIPERGTRVDEAKLVHLQRLKVHEHRGGKSEQQARPSDAILH